MNLAWGSWFYGLMAGGIGGGASAVSAGLIAGGIDQHFAFGSSNSFRLMMWMFVMSFVKDAMLYLKQNPLPAVKTVTTVGVVERLQNPTRVVTTTIEKTEVEPASTDGGGKHDA